VAAADADTFRASRRDHALGAPSARSVLLTVLGEYVLVTGGRAWTGALVDALGVLGVEEKSARQALARSAARGWLTKRRSGRQVAWELTDGIRGLLEEGAERIYTFGRTPAEWDGQWLLLFTSVPVERRELRERLRTRLGWAGFGAFGPGTWISPRAAARATAERVLGDLDLADGASFFVGRFGGDPERLLQSAWDLDALAAGYEAFLGRVTAWTPRTDAEVFACQTRLVHQWRRFPFLDPDLPPELLPADWIGTRAATAFEQLHQRWRPEALAWWTRTNSLRID
jgi:phenylacetic acid degradation operon negative regulatory protein